MPQQHMHFDEFDHQEDSSSHKERGFPSPENASDEGQKRSPRLGTQHILLLSLNQRVLLALVSLVLWLLFLLLIISGYFPGTHFLPFAFMVFTFLVLVLNILVNVR